MNRMVAKEQIEHTTPLESAVGLSFKIPLAFAAVYLIWGTTYMGMAFAVKTIPPFIVAASRYLIAGMVLLGILFLRGEKFPTWNQWKWSALIGCCLMVGGNGLVMWGIQEIPSGICAVIIATMPLWMTLFDWLFYQGPRPSWAVVMGLLLGMVGIILLIGPRELMLGETLLHLPSLVAVICAPVFWCLGSLQSRKADLPANVFTATGAQMLCGGMVLALISFCLGEPHQFAVPDITPFSLLAVLYLAIFGSLIAMTAYMWLLKNATASRVATYTYINPIIAVFLGWLILDEPITEEMLLAIVLIVTAVAMIVTLGQRSRKKKI